MTYESETARLAIAVSWVAVDEIDREEVVALLPAQDRERASEFTHEDALAHFLAGRWLTRTMLGDRGLAFDVDFRRGAHGKPLIEGGPSFNLSHSNGVAVCAVTSRQHVPVGIDVEAPWRKTDIDAIGSRFFAATESETLGAMSRDARREAFFELWTLKEALLKGTGKGLKTPLAEVVFARNVKWELSARLDGTWSFEQWRLPTNHIVSLAVGTEGYEVNEPRQVSFRRS